MANEMTKQNDQENPDRLEESELEKTREIYKNLTKRFTEWIKTNAVAHGWRETMTPRSTRSWTLDVQKLRKYRNELNERLGIPQEPEQADLESPFKGKSVLQIAQQADFLNEKGVRLPRDEQASLEKCIELRRKANRHYSTFELADMSDPRDYPKLLKSNGTHEFFIRVIWYIKRMLWEPRYYLAMKIYKIFGELKDMSHEVMDAWRLFKKNGTGLIQATLITHAAATRGFGIEWETYEQMKEETEKDERLLDILNQWIAARDPAFLNVENDVYSPSFMTDLRGLLQVDLDDEKPSAINTLKDNLELLHFPTIPVLANFRAISKLWNSQKERTPVPGYPVDLEHVYQEDLFDKSKGKTGGRGKKRKMDLSHQNARKKLKTTYEDEIKLTWKCLNEIKLLQTYIITEHPGKGYFLKELSVNEGGASLPSDIISLCLIHIVRDNTPLLMSLSFAVQLLVKINSIFNKATEKDGVPHPKTVAEMNQIRMDEYYNDRLHERIRKDKSTRMRTIYWKSEGLKSHRDLKLALLKCKDEWSSYSGKFDWKIDNEGNETFQVVENRRQRTVPIAIDDGLVKISHSRHIPKRRMDANWYADLGPDPQQTQFYLWNQPQYVGQLALQRRLLDYQADLNYANEGLAIFVFAHLVLALNVLEQQADPRARQAEAILEQSPEWFAAALPSNASELLRLVESRLPRIEGAGGAVQYDFSDTAMRAPKHVDLLWSLFMDGEGDLHIDTFARQLEDDRARGGNELQMMPKRKLTWAKLVGMLKKGLPKLPCGDVLRTYFDYEFMYAGHLERLGQMIGCKRRNATESKRDFHARLLYVVLDDFKAREDVASAMRTTGRKPKAWRAKTHLKKVKDFRDKKIKPVEEQERERERVLGLLDKR